VNTSALARGDSLLANNVRTTYTKRYTWALQRDSVWLSRFVDEPLPNRRCYRYRRIFTARSTYRAQRGIAMLLWYGCPSVCNV